MLDAAHEARAPVLVACTPPFAAEPPNKRILVFAVENGLPRKCSQFSGADRFSRCRLHADIYEPIVNYLGIAGGIVKRATTIGQTARLGSCEPPQRPWERHGYGRWSSDIMRIASQHRYEATREAAG
jgi:hypothetical protein